MKNFVTTHNYRYDSQNFSPSIIAKKFEPLLPAVRLSGVYRKKLQQQTCSDGSQPDSNLKSSHPTAMTATREDNIGSFALIHLFDKVIP